MSVCLEVLLLFLVPARIGTKSFALQKIDSIDSLDTYDHELAKRTPVRVTFTVGWYEWDGKDGEGQRTDGSPSKMKVAWFEKAISFNLREVIVLYEPASVEELASSISSSPDVFV